MQKNSMFRVVIAPLFLSLTLLACKKQDLPGAVPNVNSALVNLSTSTSTSTIAPTAIRIEAESFSAMSGGVQAEPCGEGGQNVGYIAQGSWMDYKVNVPAAGTYQVNFRTAGASGKLQLQSGGTVLATVDLPSTSSGQTYVTTTATVTLAAGQQTLRVYALSANWNFNWFELVGGSSNTNTPAPAPAPPQTTNTGVSNLKLVSTFEDATSFNAWTKETCRPDALTITNSISRKGNGSARFEFAKNDVTQFNHYLRSEIHQDSDPADELWYGFSNYLLNWVSDPVPEVIAQWHDLPDWSLGENWRSPPISLMVQNDHYFVKVMWASAAVNTNNTKDGEIYYDLGPVNSNTWNDWAIHIKFSYQSDGVLEVWKNKQKVLTRNGPNTFNDQYHPYFKLGIYKWGWDGNAQSSPEDKRVLYYDEVRIGNKNSNLDEVSPK